MEGMFISRGDVHVFRGGEEESLCVFMLVCWFPLAVLSDIWQGDFLACGQAERGKRSVRRQAA